VLWPLLKRTLKKAKLNFEEMTTILCDCEAVMNSRPLTYITDEADDMAVITPNMFLRDTKEDGIPDLDQINRTHFTKRLRYCQRLREELRKRFRIEYLGSLATSNKREFFFTKLKVNDIVLVANDLQKRIDWPMARVKKIFTGQDGNVRVVKLQIAGDELIRPIQKLISLEMTPNIADGNGLDDIKSKSKTHKNLKDSQGALEISTRSGRIVRKPERLGF